MALSERKDVLLESHEDFSLVTVFSVAQCPKSKITESWMQESVQKYKSTDDVFHEAFLSGVIFHGASEDVEIADNAQDFLSKLGTQWIQYMPPTSPAQNLLPGPYVLVGNRLRDVWRLFDDTNGAFMMTFRPRKG